MNTYLYFLRHGEVAGGEILRGVTDDPVTEQGLEQMAQAVGDMAFDVIISSPLIRCLQFAKEYKNQQAFALIVDHRLAEINFGDWDGQFYASLFSEKNSPAEQYFAHPYLNTIPNGECTQEFDKRVWSAITNIVHEHQGKRILIVTHAGVMRSVLARSLGFHFSDKTSGYLSVKIGFASLLLFECFSSGDKELTLTLSL